MEDRGTRSVFSLLRHPLPVTTVTHLHHHRPHRPPTSLTQPRGVSVGQGISTRHGEICLNRGGRS
ncbi:hypothetical protein RchiOBHm_Chr1g0315271 [Rosa chinensis]|uniref:Uncharacterized protein n=1 Tax=Rosa chinensis TaxID=74649 RepID=A0A2P6S7B7_ROSCH|nr:hypothetical protein RchiOBHm_Chr1g0315271 [Rosa chinensis]